MSEISRVLRSVTEPVMGCTEPAAVALAASLAAAAVRGQLPRWTQVPPMPEIDPDAAFELELLDVRTTRSLFKNAMAVGLPNTNGASGIHLAAALGAFLPGDDKLNLLKLTNGRILHQAQALLGSGRAQLQVDERDEEIFIEARAIGLLGTQRHVGEVILRGRHDGLAVVRRDGQELLRKPVQSVPDEVNADLERLSRGSLAEVIRAARAIDDDDRKRLLEGAAMNREAARLGLERRLGLGVGASLSDLVQSGQLGDGIVTTARIVTAAAADARMSGYEVEIMASGGSGNQGIMASLPAAVVAEHIQASPERLAEALAFGHLLTAVMTVGAGILGAMCGCVVKAGVGAAASTALLLSGDQRVVEGAINNMVGNIVGEICDGAKVGCALKLGTAAGTAVESALLAQRGLIVPDSNGIVGRHAFETLGSVFELAGSMRELDRRIVEIMRAKAR